MLRDRALTDLRDVLPFIYPEAFVPIGALRYPNPTSRTPYRTGSLKQHDISHISW